MAATIISAGPWGGDYPGAWDRISRTRTTYLGLGQYIQDQDNIPRTRTTYLGIGHYAKDQDIILRTMAMYLGLGLGQQSQDLETRTNLTSPPTVLRTGRNSSLVTASKTAGFLNFLIKFYTIFNMLKYQTKLNSLDLSKQTKSHLSMLLHVLVKFLFLSCA